MKKYRNGTGIDKDSKAIQTIISSSIIALAIAASIIVVISRLYIENENPINSKDLWEEAFNEVENNKVGIQFNSISTTTDEYEELRSACNKYIESSSQSNTTNNIDLNLDLELDISEDTYVDNSVKSVQKTNTDVVDKSESAVETGPLYFEDILMIRYIDSHGNLSVVLGIFINNKIQILRQDELQSKIKLGITKDNKSDINIDSSHKIDENTYLYNVSDCISKLLLSKDLESENLAVNKSLPYFTSDGKNAVLSSRQLINESANSTKLKVCLCGKSDTSKIINDRIYMQFDILDSNQSILQTINIIAKLNSNLRVFDIDIV